MIEQYSFTDTGNYLNTKKMGDLEKENAQLKEDNEALRNMLLKLKEDKDVAKSIVYKRGFAFWIVQWLCYEHDSGFCTREATEEILNLLNGDVQTNRVLQWVTKCLNTGKYQFDLDKEPLDKEGRDSIKEFIEQIEDTQKRNNFI